MKIRPLNDRVLVLREDEGKKSAGGIIIPDTAKEKPQRGKVVEIGVNMPEPKLRLTMLSTFLCVRTIFCPFLNNGR
jgi:chaperonin GroES